MQDEFVINNQIINQENLIPLLANYGMMPILIRETIIERAIENIDCQEEEILMGLKHFFQRSGITNRTEHEVWLQHYKMTQAQLDKMVTRRLKIKKFQQQMWGHKLESYFLERKKQLDKVIYSMIRTDDEGIARELYFRIQAGEENFAELACNYSQGAETNTNGIVGPVELGTLNPIFANQLAVSQPGKVWEPIKFGESFLIIRVEKFISVKLDPFTRQRLINELFEGWLNEQINQLSDIDKSWFILNRQVAEYKQLNAA
ncbi:MAG: peptidylprolyl isomerase [Cyanobacteria bacterium P01_D01_bin.116]